MLDDRLAPCSTLTTMDSLVSPAPAATQGPAAAMRWRVEEIDWNGIDHARIADDELLFYLLTSASFIESGSDLYTRNLIGHYARWPDVAQWLAAHWEQEELQHGRAFASYVQAAWPQFPLAAGV